MASLDRPSKSLGQRLWSFGCSLKLAIALASMATALIMGGSLVMHFNPAIFSGMEQEIMSRWLPQAWAQAPLLVLWVPLSGLCVLLFGINTLCCLIDWLFKIKARWRKTGEYLIHAGFILLVIAYLWGSIGGFRSGPHRIFPGERIALPNMPEYSLQLDEFTPRLEPSGRPLDMINRVSLWQDGELAARALVRINHPLIHDGLVILPTSFGQELQGFRFHMPGRGYVDLAAGSRLPVSPETTLVVLQLLPDARQDGQGRVMQVSDRLNNPAMLLSLSGPAGQLWQGWYFLRSPLPGALQEAGLALRPTEPLYKTFSLLTINRDPGDKLALVGSMCIAIGVILAFFSFYRKRAQGDRPEV
ncbi:MAG: cytochrome c biogenesis protein ResB [Desulfuromonadales bacterium]|nr:cytochrome c biogenesis protein ResB [Desulfuromonadales bacterium]